MENRALTAIYGPAPYMTSLADNYSLAQHYTAIDHPSLPNYLAQFSGLAGDCSNNGNTTGGCMAGGASSTTDCSPSSTCTMGADPNLVDRLEDAGLTWSAYAEDLPTSNPCNGTNIYPTFTGVRHFPFFYFTDITSSSARCARTYHASAGADPELIAELNTAAPANFIWLTPNLCNDMHDCNTTTGDNYLKNLVPQILATSAFTSKRSALFIVFDEGTALFPSDYVYATWAGPVVNNAFKSSNQYTHYSFLRTVESNWGLPPLQTTDGKATTMSEFFLPPTTPTPIMPLILLLVTLAVSTLALVLRRKIKHGTI